MSPLAGVLVAGNLVLDTVIMTAPETTRWNTSHWVDRIEQHPGGNCANTAYTIARLGVPSRALGYAGRDLAGDWILGMLAEAAVDVACIERSDLPTASSAVLVRGDGAGAFLHSPGVSRVAFSETPSLGAPVTDGCGYFHLANPFAVPGLRVNGPAMLWQTRALGLRTSLDAGWDSHGEWMKVIEPCLPFTDILFVNAEEARQLTRQEDPWDAAAMLRNAGAGCVVVKRGEQGCSVYSGRRPRHIAGFRVTAVDTTGAGDCFAGGFLAALSRGLPLPEAARIANLVGALSVRKPGSTGGLLSFEETLAWAESFSSGLA